MPDANRPLPNASPGARRRGQQQCGRQRPSPRKSTGLAEHINQALAVLHTMREPDDDGAAATRTGADGRSAIAQADRARFRRLMWQWLDRLRGRWQWIASTTAMALASTTLMGVSTAQFTPNSLHCSIRRRGWPACAAAARAASMRDMLIAGRRGRPGAHARRHPALRRPRQGPLPDHHRPIRRPSAISTRAWASPMASTMPRRSPRSARRSGSIPTAPCAGGARRWPTAPTSTRRWTPDANALALKAVAQAQLAVGQASRPPNGR